MIIISACLAGIPCRYDGKATPDAECMELVEQGKAKTACPELMGGLTAPREPCEIAGGDGYDVLAGRARVMNKKGADVTAEFVAGAKMFFRNFTNGGRGYGIFKGKEPFLRSWHYLRRNFQWKIDSGRRACWQRF